MIRKLWKDLWYKILTRNKFLLTIAFFLVWVVFFDKNNLIDRREYTDQLEQLRKDKAYYEEKIHRDSARLQQLKHNAGKLERFAREQYYMKAPDEDIFIIERPDNPDTKSTTP